MSVVTLCYLHRFLSRAVALFDGLAHTQVALSTEVAVFMSEVASVLECHASSIGSGPVGDEVRKQVMEALGTAAERYREGIYSFGFCAEKVSVPLEQVSRFLTQARDVSAVSIKSNRREDGLYHAYNRIAVGEVGVEIRHLYEMLEGQVAVLSSELLSPEESLSVLTTLRASSLYTARQHSYLLYPDRRLPAFMERNMIPDGFARSSSLVGKLIAASDRSLIETDEAGQTYFAGHFNNTAAVADTLTRLANGGYRQEVDSEREAIESLFSDLFDCANFTGRSGGMYAFEGLGSIYWHMVSKLLLAVMETVKRAEQSGAPADVMGRLKRVYYDVREGIGFNKAPEVYGAFPTDPYSHTPGFSGARQPGMTGQVKEEVLTRLLELGVMVDHAQVTFKPTMLRASEFLQNDEDLRYFDTTGAPQLVTLARGQLGFTYCQVPVVMAFASQPSIRIQWVDGTDVLLEGSTLSVDQSEALFKKTGVIKRLDVCVNEVIE
jgi:hypothetical protein